jgi:GT2 family glycosyltransferase
MPTSPTESRAVTVSIVSHGQWPLAQALLADLDRWCGKAVAKVVLTVNVPEVLDATRRWRFPIDIVPNASPKGFGANHNAAFGRCTTPWFLVLNPDIRLDSDVISELLAQAGASAGLLAPRILEPGKREPEPFRGLLTPMELLARRRRGHLPPAAPVWVAGMFMLVRSEAYAQVGGFDARFFMYCEDFDLCARLRLAGWQVQVERSSAVLHLAQRASQASLRPLRWHLASFVKVWTSATFWRYRRLLKREAAGAS